MNAPARWSGATIALHWLSAALIVALLAQGWIMVHGDLAAATKFDLYQQHKSLGFLSLALLLARLAARAVHPAPAPPASMASWERRAAKAAHLALYGLMLAAVASGWLLVSAAILAIPTRFFGLFVIPGLTGPNAALSAAATTAHYVISRAMIGLIALHGAAALKHHWLDRDEVLRRMLPGWRG